MLTLAKTIGLSILNFFGFVIDMVKRYPLQIILVLVCIYAFWQKSRYDAITSKYEAYKDSITQAAKLEKIKNDILRKQAETALNDAVLTYDNNLKAIKNEYLKKQKLDSVTIGDLRNRLRDQLAASGYTVPETPSDTENTEVWRERYSKLVGQYETLKYGCAITTADFNVCRDWIDISCLQVGCE